MTETKKNNLRERLLKATVELLSRQGVGKLTMRSLSHEVGVSRTAAYRHFTDKNALLCAVAEQGFKKLTQAYKMINSNSSIDALERFRRIGIAYVQFAVENPGQYRLMFGNEIVRQKRSSGLLHAAQETFDELLLSIKSCQEENILKSANPLYLANMAWAMVHGLSSLFIDDQIRITDETGGLPTLLTKDRFPDSKNIEQFIEFTRQILTDFI